MREIATNRAVRAGEALASFLGGLSMLHAQEDFRRYLALWSVPRWRVVRIEGSSVVEIALPANKMQVMAHVARLRPMGVVWYVRPLKWWERGRRFSTRDDGSWSLG